MNISRVHMASGWFTHGHFSTKLHSLTSSNTEKNIHNLLTAHVKLLWPRRLFQGHGHEHQQAITAGTVCPARATLSADPHPALFPQWLAGGPAGLSEIWFEQQAALRETWPRGRQNWREQRHAAATTWSQRRAHLPPDGATQLWRSRCGFEEHKDAPGLGTVLEPSSEHLGFGKVWRWTFAAPWVEERRRPRSVPPGRDCTPQSAHEPVVMHSSRRRGGPRCPGRNRPLPRVRGLKATVSPVPLATEPPGLGGGCGGGSWRAPIGWSAGGTGDTRTA